jgi:integrase
MGRAHRHERLTDAKVAALPLPPPGVRYYLVWDDDRKPLCIAVHAGGAKTWKLVYKFKGRTRWKTVGAFPDVGVKRAREAAIHLAKLLLDGVDPQHEAMELKKQDSFEKLTLRFFDEHARANLKAWPQLAYLLDHYIPRWFNEMRASEVTKVEVARLVLPLRARVPVSARQVLAAISSVMQWAVEESFVLDRNVCRDLKRPKKRPSRTRTLLEPESDLRRFWQEFGNCGVTGTALRSLLLVGQRPGEVAHLRREHLRDGSWIMPGEPTDVWPGTKNSAVHWLPLPAPAVELISELTNEKPPTGYVFGPRPDLLHHNMQVTMRAISTKLGVPMATPHDCRRTHGTCLTGLFGLSGRALMHMIQNHRAGGMTEVYDMFAHKAEVRAAMERVAAEIIRIAEGRETDNVVVPLRP